jgi:hypothetical protein
MACARSFHWRWREMGKSGGRCAAKLGVTSLFGLPPPLAPIKKPLFALLTPAAAVEAPILRIRILAVLVLCSEVGGSLICPDTGLSPSAAMEEVRQLLRCTLCLLVEPFSKKNIGYICHPTSSPVASSINSHGVLASQTIALPAPQPQPPQPASTSP